MCDRILCLILIFATPSVTLQHVCVEKIKELIDINTASEIANCSLYCKNQFAVYNLWEKIVRLVLKNLMLICNEVDIILT
jgi:hypothetical protein